MLRVPPARVFAPVLLSLAALPALADDDRCEHSRPIPLEPDLKGVASIRFEIGASELDLRGSDGQASLSALACVSDPDYFDQLRFTQERRGDTLVITARRDGQSVGLFFRPTYAYLKVTATLPRGLAYEVDVGSGEAAVRDVASLDSQVGSGELEVFGVAGRVATGIGSGDFLAEDIGSLMVRSIGSGDAEVRGVKGDARVGSIGSGDLELHRVGGSVEIGSIGSGDASLRGVRGDVTIGSIGSGDADIVDVTGDVTVRSIGSGDAYVREVRGKVSLPEGR
ncbi:DUF4097 family beta strand repeat-containing protein [Arenimonas fontis]|uniref:DUF4097 domain-containing protein n=1 Tax=Arenimonas fontis TaxID=2608255 RepID=A0A5B2ZGD2_9GAMM|nr:hypothetical protein [Arenimonas fontis]KAA2286121.1 hypothetical protein F0415_01050 [Arenimonas fontis]